MRRAIVAALMVVAWLSASEARADVKLPALFCDGMVLQSGAKTPIWGTASSGEEISVILEMADGKSVKVNPIQAGSDGHWQVTFSDDLKPGGPFTLTVTGRNTVTLHDVYVGEVWLCSGQSNMEWPLVATTGGKEAIEQSKNPQLRLFTVAHATADEPLHDVKGKWQECNPDTVKNFSAVAYYFGLDLQKALKVPVGLIHSSWGGTRAEAWTRHEVLESHAEWKGEFPAYAKAKADYAKAMEHYSAELEKYKQAAAKAKEEGNGAPPAPKTPYNPAHNPNSPSVLYNGMIAPLIPYGMKGAIWYQGESNAGSACLYRKLFPVMIQNWRDDWKRGDFPFLFVQLAPWQAIVKEPQESNWAELREAQLLTSEHVPHTAMAVITDVGDPKDIHPRNKAPVGARLALAARAVAYGEPIEYSGPVYESMEVTNHTAVLHFKHVSHGLEARGGALEGFTVAGEDHKFHNAQAEIRKNTVHVWSDKVAKPVAVRYGWANCPVVNLWNKDGLPASPFRTDDFPMVTKPK